MERIKCEGVGDNNGFFEIKIHPRRCGKTTMHELMLAEFKPDKRQIALEERLRKYYADTPDSMPNSVAAGYRRGFARWCVEHGYTNDEVNRAKRILSP